MHPLLTCVLFSILRCLTGGNTAASHNVDSWFWLFLLSSNKLDVLVCCWLSVVRDYAPNNRRSGVTSILKHLQTIDF